MVLITIVTGANKPTYSVLPSCDLLHSYGKSPFLMGISSISMAIFNSYVSLPEGIP